MTYRAYTQVTVQGAADPQGFGAVVFRSGKAVFCGQGMGDKDSKLPAFPVPDGIGYIQPESTPVPGSKFPLYHARRGADKSIIGGADRQHPRRALDTDG